jgi:hypothetical protein
MIKDDDYMLKVNPSPLTGLKVTGLKVTGLKAWIPSDSFTERNGIDCQCRRCIHERQEFTMLQNRSRYGGKKGRRAMKRLMPMIERRLAGERHGAGSNFWESWDERLFGVNRASKTGSFAQKFLLKAIQEDINAELEHRQKSLKELFTEGALKFPSLDD